jgi:hypothetical protein
MWLGGKSMKKYGWSVLLVAIVLFYGGMYYGSTRALKKLAWQMGVDPVALANRSVDKTNGTDKAAPWEMHPEIMAAIKGQLLHTDPSKIFFSADAQIEFKPDHTVVLGARGVPTIVVTDDTLADVLWVLVCATNRCTHNAPWVNNGAANDD